VWRHAIWGSRSGYISHLGLTLVEVLIVIVVLAVLAAIVAPRFVAAGARSKQSARERNVQLLQDAVERFHSDCGAYPAGLKDLASETAPSRGIDKDGNARSISPADWHGPYIDAVPLDPLDGKSYSIRTTPSLVGQVGLPEPSPEVTPGLG
jgi:type II secretion system protein G